MYREWPYELDGAVVWTRSGTPTGEARILPDGCMDLLWNGSLLVAGPDTAAWTSADDAGVDYAAVRFRPGQAPAILGVSAVELRDQRVPLDAVWSAARVRRLADLIGAAPDPAAALAAYVGGRLAHAEPDPVVGAVASLLGDGVSVERLPGEVGLSARQLRRRCVAAFGYGPKTLERVLRFQRALALARRGLRFADIAARTGHADQAHLAREVRSLAGVSLRDLIGAPSAAG